MAWLERHKRGDGTIKYFLRDQREDRQISIALPDGIDEAEALRRKERYEIRRDLEKEGYDDGLD